MLFFSQWCVKNKLPCRAGEAGRVTESEGTFSLDIPIHGHCLCQGQWNGRREETDSCTLFLFYIIIFSLST